jgi:3-dehydroquinate synthase
MPPRTFDLEFGSPSTRTRLWIGRRGWAEASASLADWIADRALFVVTTPRVWSLHGEGLGSTLSRARRLTVLEVPDGESAKSLGVAGDLWRRMMAAGGKRDSRLMTFGGGSVGDLGGFVAACFLRGIEYAQAPTTLLAQVDASIGGKTGLDLPEAKNSVGAFHAPRWVISDTGWLATLEARELRSGWVEALKAAILFDADLFSDLERIQPWKRPPGGDELDGLLGRCAAHKIAVVRQDPLEVGARRLLNLGHTLGHALETALDYQGLRHGEAVAYGILFVLRLAVARGMEPGQADRVAGILSDLQLPPLPVLDGRGILDLMARDKKATERDLRWVLPRRIGEATVEGVRPDHVAQALRAFLVDPWSPAARSDRAPDL